MTVRETADILHFEILTGGGALDRPIQSVYSCDLLSFVMGRAPADSAWATVMGNVNAMAVAVLAVIQNESYLVDICLIYAMISFLAVIVLCKIYMGVYAERKKQEEQKTRLDDLEKAGSAQEKEEG